MNFKLHHRLYLFFVFCFGFIAFVFAVPPVYAIRHVNVIPMNREVVLKDQTVVVEDGKVKSIGTTNDVPENAIVINAGGRYLMPSLFDMHAHFFYEQGNNRNTCAAELKVMLANGIGIARIQCGDSVYLEARKNVEDKQWSGPRLFVSSPQFVGNWPWPGKVFAEICKTPDEARVAVRKCKERGYDEIKITFMMKRDVYDAILETARELNINVTGHVGPLVKLPAALAAREQIEHMDEFIDMLLPDTTYNHGESVSDMNIWRKRAWETVPCLDEGKIPALVNAVKESGISVTPTNYFFFSSFGDSCSADQYRQRPDFGFIPPEIEKERWDVRDHYWNKAPLKTSRMRYIALRKKITLGLWKAGVNLMAGSDSPEWFLVQGFSIHDELETFVGCGLSTFGALETATINPARYLRIENTSGTIEVGKDADMILLDKNPLDDIRNTRTIVGVFKGGKYYSNEALKKMLDEAKQTLSSG